MDESLVQEWITQVLVPFLKPICEGNGRRRESLVVLGSYRGHLTEAVGQTMRMFRLTRADKGEVELLEDVNELVDDEVVVNPYYAEARVTAEVLQADDDAMEVEEEGYGAGEGGDAEEWSEAGFDWWLPDGEEVEEWHAGDDDE
ncbi:unnamed protein product [Closterium sp. Yama58-4]|nr:unnamed protein product [Closterium sp. Yama58-4]